MKTMTTECRMCGEEYVYYDMRNIPPTCGSKMCETNFRYQQTSTYPIHGKKMSAEEIKKW